MSQAKHSEHTPPLRLVREPPAAFRLGLRGSGTVARRAWRHGYVRRLVLWDAICALAAAGAALLVRFGPAEAVAGPVPQVIAVVLPAVWVFAMLVSRCYEEQFLFEGPEEFRRVLFAAALLVAGVATVSWALKLEVARGFVVLALPLATILTLVHRQGQRVWLRHQRARGRFLQTTLLVGRSGGIAALHEQLAQEPRHGYRVIGCCLSTTGADSQLRDDVPVLGGPGDVVEVVRRYEVDTVAVLPSPELDGDDLRRLGWELERTRAELLLAPAVTEVAGPRVRIRPVCGLSLLQMERPELRGWRRIMKAAFDRTGALAALFLLVPVFVVLAVGVKATSAGPVFFRQERVGRDGRSFSMLKFRSMHVDADRMIDQLAGLSTGNGVLFKMRLDPRVTPLGRLLRRYSVDELPQLLNVLRGEMSLVGPRPPLPSEVALYDVQMRRRFAVKPGLTGLWQVSGRSDLSWDDSVRLDVHYVENWSLVMDLMIIGRTFGAVVRGNGAY